MLIGELLVQQQQDYRLLAVGQFTRCHQTVRGCLTAQHGSGTGLTHQALHRGVLLGSQGFVEQRPAAGVGLFEQRQGRLPAHFHIRAEQLQGRQGRVNLATQAVVQHHIFRIGGHGHRLSGHRVLALPLAHHQHLAVGDFDHIVGQRLQIGSGFFIPLAHGLGQRLDARIAFPHRNASGFVHRQGLRG